MKAFLFCRLSGDDDNGDDYNNVMKKMTMIKVLPSKGGSPIRWRKGESGRRLEEENYFISLSNLNLA